MAILLTIIAVLTSLRIESLNRDIDNTNHHLYPKTVIANKIKDKVTEAVIRMRNSLLLTDTAKVKDELDSIETGAKLVIASIEKSEKSANSEENKQFLVKMNNVSNKFAATRKRFAALVFNNELDRAHEALFSEVGLAQMAYYDILDQLVAHEDTLMRDSGKKSGENAMLTQRLILAFTLAALVISASVAWYTTRSITRTLANAVAVARRVANGDLTSVIVMETSDAAVRYSPR